MTAIPGHSWISSEVPLLQFSGVCIAVFFVIYGLGDFFFFFLRMVGPSTLAWPSFFSLPGVSVDGASLIGGLSHFHYLASGLTFALHFL